MKFRNWFSRSFAKWTMAISFVMLGSFAWESQAFGHHPFRRLHGCFGSYGWNSNYYFGGYSSFYGGRSSCFYPSLSFCYSPRYFSVNYYSPAYCTPVYFAPVYYQPVYYAPTYDPCYSWSGVNYSVGFPMANISPQQGFGSGMPVASKQVHSPLSMQPRSRPLNSLPVGIKLASVIQKADDSKVETHGIQLVSKKPALLQPYSPIWTQAAAGIVDDMVAAGELENANSSCKSMERITQPKGAGVYLRQALLKYFSADDSAATVPAEEVLRLLELACEAGSQVESSELGKGSLQDYFSACSVNVAGSMERLSKSVLESPNSSARELLLLAALLRLEGKADQSKLFANEVADLITNSNLFQWNKLLTVCLGESQTTVYQ